MKRKIIYFDATKGETMAYYRTVSMSFWTDAKVVEDFTPEDRYFYLYLFTNPHTNLCGCYEVSTKQIAYETGYDQGTIERLIKRFAEVHKVLCYSKQTKEVLLINWHKFNWTTSEKYRKPLKAAIDSIKEESFKSYLMDLYECMDTVSIPYPYGTDTTNTNTISNTNTNTISNTNTNTISNTNTNSISNNKSNSKDKSINKKRYGEYKKVLLTDEEYIKLINEYGQDITEEMIRFLDEYITEKGYASKSHYLAMRRWVFKAVKENARSGKNKTAQELDDFYAMAQKWAEGEDG